MNMVLAVIGGIVVAIAMQVFIRTFTRKNSPEKASVKKKRK